MTRPKLRHGFVGGLLGGLVFAGIMVIHSLLGRSGMLDFPRIGQLVGADSAWVGFLVHMVNSSVLGIGYVLFFGRIEKGMVDGLRLGTIYGAACWLLGPLTLLPLSLLEPLRTTWNFAAMLGMFPSFVGHLVYGVIVGLTVGAAGHVSLPADPRPLSEQTTQKMERPRSGELQ